MQFSARLIDHTLLRADATTQEIEKLCDEARAYQFASVCINPHYLALAKKRLLNTNVKLCTVVGFPLGASTTATKISEAKEAVQMHATEIDMVIDIAAIKNKQFNEVEQQINKVVLAVSPHIVKVILETCLLTSEEIVTACKIAVQAGAHFVKTSTGFSHTGATLENVKLMRSAIPNDVGLKASGGIKTLACAQAMLDAGATRLGMSSSVVVVNDFLNTFQK